MTSPSTRGTTLRRRWVVASVATLALGAGAAAIPAANATPTNATSQDSSGRAVLKSSTKNLGKYSDQDVLRLLLAAQGPAAERNPELRRILGFDPAKPKTDEKALASIIKAYLAYNPKFHDQTTVPMQSGNPKKVDAGLRTFSVSFNKFIDLNSKKFAETQRGSTDAQARGWFWMGANVAIYANAVGAANAVVYANAGVATFALAALAIVTWYLEDESPATTSFERDHFIKTMTDSLA